MTKDDWVMKSETQVPNGTWGPRLLQGYNGQIGLALQSGDA